MRVILQGLVVVVFSLATFPAVAVQYQWTQLTSAAAFPARDGGGGVTYDGKMWLLGGWYPPSCNDVWNSTDGATWTQVRTNNPTDSTMWTPRHCAGYAVLNNKMWVVGSDFPASGHYQADAWNSTDGVNWTQTTANAPWGQRTLHVTMAYNGKLWVMGGQTMPNLVPSVPLAFYNDVWNSSDGVNWTQVTANAGWSPRGMIQGSFEFNGRMWLVGGGTYDTSGYPRHYYNDVWSSADGLNWTQATANAPWTGRQYQSVGVFDNKIWVMAGYNGGTGPGGALNDVWYSSDGVSWTNLPNTPWAPRHAPTLFTYNNHMYIAAGTTTTVTNEVWRLDAIGVPEPASASLLICAGLSLLAYAWRRRIG
jgi:hypothetical protein